ncbi:MAG: Ig-like domain-containing protein, partial [Thermodesulfobacteriota bacterium]
MTPVPLSRAFSCRLAFLWLIGTLFVLVAARPLPAAEVTLAWDPNPEPELAGYQIYWGLASGSYTDVADAGNATQFTVTGLPGGQTFYFAATAYDGVGNESAFSNELIWTSPADLTPPVNNPPVAEGLALSVDEDTVLAAGLLASDPDGDPVTFQVQAGPSHGTLTLSNPATGAFTYQPTANFTGADSFTFLVTDGEAASNAATVLIAVLPQNDPPVAGADTGATSEELAVTIDVLANDSDPDGDPLAVTGTQAGSHGTTAVAGNRVVYTPAPDFSGSDVFTYQVGDGQGATATGTVTVTVQPVNDPPRAVADAASTDEDTPVTIDVLANDSDVDGDSLTLVALGRPGRGTIAASGNRVIYTPPANASGSDSFTYHIADGQGGTAASTVAITIRPVNDPPLANTDLASTGEDTTVVVDVLANDSDPDGDALSLTSATAGAFGSTSVSGSRIVYAPAANASGTDSFFYQIADGHGGTATGTVTVTVQPVNDPPIATADTANTDEDTAVTIDCLANDRDPEGQALTLASAGPGSHGTTTVSGNRVVYTPAADWYGTDTFTYQVADDLGSTATGTVTVVVQGVSDPLVVTPDTAATDEDRAVTVDVVANDTNADRLAITVTGAGQGSHGSTAVSSNQVVYTPAADWHGTDSFTYQIASGSSQATGTGTVTVQPVNDPPQAVADSATTSEDTPVTVAVLANDTDPDGDPLAITVLGAASLGRAQLEGNRIVYTPDPDVHGTGVFTYALSAGQGGTATGTVTVTIQGVNDPPVAMADTATSSEDTAVIVDVLGNDLDPDGEALVVTAASSGSRGRATVSDNRVLYTPDANANGIDSFTYQISDGQGGNAFGTVTVTIQAVDDPLTAGSDAATTDEDSPALVDVLANDTDPDGTELILVAVTPGTHGSTAVSGRRVLYTPAANWHGSDTFTYQVSDGQGSTASAVVTVLVHPVNDRPSAVADTASTSEDTAVTVDVLANDMDPDQDPLTVTSVSAGTAGATVVSANRVVYTPDADWHGTDSFSYQISDSHGGTATGTVTVTVRAVNDPPQAAADTASTSEDTSVAVSVLANDVDRDGDPLTVAAVGNGGHGLASTDGRQVVYDPEANWSGTDSFTYQVEDGRGGTATATVTVVVQATGDPVLAGADTASTDEDTEVLVDVLANDRDADGDALTITGVGAATNGRTAASGPRISYTPAANWSGTDSFAYQVSDGRGSVASGTVSVVVRPVNDPPAATADGASTEEDTAVSIAVLANDLDLDGDPLTLVAAGSGNLGTTTLAGNRIQYTPAGNRHGSDSLTYQISDGHGASATGTVTVTIRPVNDPPAASSDAATTPEDQPVVIDVLANDTDPDSDTLSVASVATPGHGTATVASGRITYTPAVNWHGPDTFTYRLSDGNGGAATGTVSVTVQPVNDPPVAASDTAVVDEDGAVTVDVLANDTDPEGDPLALTSASAGSNGSTAVTGNQVVYTPAANFHGSDSFSYQVSDGQGGQGTATVTVTVRPVNDAPVARADSASTTESTAVTIDVLANDSDPDGDTLTIASATAGSHGTAAVAGNRLVYTPAAGYAGADTVSYGVADGQGGQASATVAITVQAVSSPVTASADTAATGEDTAISIAVLANDAGRPGAILRLTAVGTANNGQATISGDRVVYTPAADFHGTDTFMYQVTDDRESTGTGAVTVTVRPVNDPPRAVADTAATNEDAAVTVAVLANDVDLDGDALTLSTVFAPGHGSAVASGNRVSYTPAANWSGTDSFTYRLSDGHDGTAEGTVTVTVRPVNDPPQAAADSASAGEDTPVSIPVLANDTDPENDPLTITGATAGSLGTTVVAGGRVVYTPAANAAGNDSFTYQVADGQGGSATGTVTVTIQPVNDPPQAAADAASTDEDTAVTLDVLANDTDPDRDGLTVTAVTAPAHGTAAVAGNRVVYTPAADWSGSDSFSYQIADGQGGTASGPVQINVRPANDMPVAAADTASLDEDSPVTVEVLANDSDRDGDPLTVTSATAGAHGTTTVVGNRVVYTPQADFFGTDQFSYQASDGRGGVASGTVTVTVRPVNDPPQAAADSASTTESFAVTIDVLANDRDPDGDTLSLASATAGSHGTTVIGGNRLVYTPAAGYAGSDSVSYVVSDGHGGTATATVTLTVQAVSTPVTAAADVAATDEDTAVTIDVLANDSGRAGAVLSLSSVGQANGGATARSGNRVVYTPAANGNGTDTFMYQVTDDRGSTGVGAVQVTVRPVNDAPRAVDDSASTNEDAAVTIDVLANDTDPDRDSLTLTGAGSATHGSTAISGSRLVYTPAANWHGTDTVSYQISDGHGGTASARVTITVQAVNDPPLAVADTATTDEDTPVTVTVLANDSDPDGDALTLASAGDGGHGSAAVSGNRLVYTPAANWSGTDTVIYQVSDGHGGTAAGTLTVTVRPVNDRPVAANDAATTDEDTPVIVDVLANDTDADQDALTVASFTAPAHGTVAASGSRLVYTPAVNWHGSDTFSYQVADGHGGTASGTVSIAVRPVNDPPVAASDTAVVDEDGAVTVDVLANDTDPEGDPLALTSA